MNHPFSAQLCFLFSSKGAKNRLREVIVTNSIPQTKEFESLPFLSIKGLSDTLSRTINRIHYSQSVSEVFYHP